MKKIWAVSTVKNEKDIIESFCRYTLQFCDGLLIQDDSSLDHTKEIIEQLIQEGLQIVLFEKPVSDAGDFTDYQSVLNEFALQAFEERGADWVLPLDADEFLFCPDYSSPRAELENMDESIEYRIYSRTYLFEQPPSDDSVFLPSQFQSFIRYPKAGRMAKTFLSRKLYYEFHAQITLGHHHLDFDAKTRPVIKYTDRLATAHFPFRSIEQMLAKVITGELNYKTSLNRNNSGLHWNLMYNAIKESQTIDAGLVRRFSLVYSGIFETDTESEEHAIEIEPFRTDFLDEPILLKYTNLEPLQYEYLDKILEDMESIISNYKTHVAAYEKTKDDLAKCRKQNADIEESCCLKIKRFTQKLFGRFPGKRKNANP